MSGGRYGSPASVLAPIMVGLRSPDPDAALLRRCWRVATLSIPLVEVPAAGPADADSGLAKAPPRNHSMVTTADHDFVLLAKLVEVQPYEPAWASLRWRWLVGVRTVEPRRFGEPFTRCATVYRIETLSYRLRDGVLGQAPQLALFRHVLVDTLSAGRPDIVVSGGQHDWRDEWWAESTG